MLSVLPSWPPRKYMPVLNIWNLLTQVLQQIRQVEMFNQIETLPHWAETKSSIDCIHWSFLCSGSRSSDRKFHGAVVLCLGVLSVFLLPVLVVLSDHSRPRGRSQTQTPPSCLTWLQLLSAPDSLHFLVLPYLPAFSTYTSSKPAETPPDPDQRPFRSRGLLQPLKRLMISLFSAAHCLSDTASNTADVIKMHIKENLLFIFKCKTWLSVAQEPYLAWPLCTVTL